MDLGRVLLGENWWVVVELRRWVVCVEMGICVGKGYLVLNTRLCGVCCW